jgi:hypothetical protein
MPVHKEGAIVNEYVWVCVCVYLFMVGDMQKKIIYVKHTRKYMHFCIH